MVKKSFTLLEIMICLMILSLIGAFTTVQIKKMIAVHQFEAEIGNLFIALQEAQLLSATYQTDLALDISSVGGKIAYSFSTDEPFTSHQFSRATLPLPNTHFCKFNNARAKTLHFDIYSGGIEPKGVLAFTPSYDETKTLWFDLQRGQLIKFSHQKPVVRKNPI